MTYWNRKKQLLNTLESIRQYNNDVKIIIIDDSSTDGNDITYLSGGNIRVVRLENKWWINPCIAFNTGFSLVDTDIVIFQNAECMHIGNIIEHAIANIDKNTYLNYSALAINREVSEAINPGNAVSLIEPYMHSRMVEGWDGNGWYNHPKYREEYLHFCSAILREDLYSIGGFDERYADGLGFDDNDILYRIRRRGMKVRMFDEPFVIHQWHEHFTPGDVVSLMTINGLRFEKTKADGIYDVKTFNNIYK